MKGEELYPIISQCTRTLIGRGEAIPEVVGIETVDVHFFICAVNVVSAQAHRERLVELLDGYPWGEVGVRKLDEGPNYIEVGAALGDQGTALRLFALGHVLGFWKVVTPKLLGYTSQREADEVAGMGLVLITGYDP